MQRQRGKTMNTSSMSFYCHLYLTTTMGTKANPFNSLPKLKPRQPTTSFQIQLYMIQDGLVLCIPIPIINGMSVASVINAVWFERELLPSIQMQHLLIRTIPSLRLPIPRLNYSVGTIV